MLKAWSPACGTVVRWGDFKRQGLVKGSWDMECVLEEDAGMPTPSSISFCFLATVRPMRPHTGHPSWTEMANQNKSFLLTRLLFDSVCQFSVTVTDT
jgi:hypothetical protein